MLRERTPLGGSYKMEEARITLQTPVQNGVLIEFVFGNAPFRDGYTQIGSFKHDASDWPHIYITAPAEWVNVQFADPDAVKDLLENLARGFIEAFNKDAVDTSKDRFRYYLMNEDEDTAITLGYFSEEKEGAVLIGIDPLSTEEFLEFEDARDKIGAFYRDTHWFTPVVENYERFGQVVQSVQEEFTIRGRPDYSGAEIVSINSAFNNFAASFTSYLKYMEKRMKNRGEAYWKRFREHTSEQYDQNVSYRFISGLRDYIQHQAPPIHIHYKAELVEEKPTHQVEIYCSKEELLRDDSWNKIKRNDILNMDDIIEISHHVDSMMESLNKILISHIQDEFAYLRESAEIIHNLLQRIPPGKDRGVYEKHFVNKKLVRMTAHMMYPQIVEAIIENDIDKILRTS